MTAIDRQRQASRSLGPGREGLSGSEVNDFQRVRIVRAMVEVSAEVGYMGASLALVVTRARMSRRTFYELFEDRQDCFLAAFEWGVAQARAAIAAAAPTGRSWRERTRLGLAALLRLFDSEPALARVCVVESLGAGERVLRRRAETLGELVAALDAGAPQPRGAGSVARLTTEGLVGGALSVIHGRLVQPQDGRLTDLHGQLMALIVLPHLGARAAGEELARPLPDLARPRTGPAQDEDGRLLERLNMRFTYRTLRCLIFLSEHPASSNREVAKGAEISDEGQASKLLARLVKLELIANRRPPGPGTPNRWSLTRYGEQVMRTLRGS